MENSLTDTHRLHQLDVDMKNLMEQCSQVQTQLYQQFINILNIFHYLRIKLLLLSKEKENKCFNNEIIY